MIAEREPKMSKQGWPLGAYAHRIGVIHANCFEDLKSKVEKQYKIKVQFKPFETSAVYGEVVVEPVRLSMERYGQIRAFVDGYRAAAY